MKLSLVIFMASYSMLVFSKADCTIYASTPVSEGLEKILSSKGYKLSENPDSTFILDSKQDKATERYLKFYPPHHVRIGERTTGSFTRFTLREGKLQLLDVYGEATSTFLRSDDYVPTKRNLKRSYKKALVSLNKHLEHCRYQ